MSLTILIGDEEYPAKYEVCSVCKGTGTSSAYLGAFTSEDLHDLGPEFQDDYARGVYDETCSQCHGRTTVLVPDEDRLSDEQRHEVHDFYRQMAELQAMEAAERRMGA